LEYFKNFKEEVAKADRYHVDRGNADLDNALLMSEIDKLNKDLAEAKADHRRSESRRDASRSHQR
jgi:hypothetical protein